jgi:hypothetical protein
MKLMHAGLMRRVLRIAAGLLSGFIVSLEITVLAGELLPVVSIRSPLQNQTVGGYVTVSAMSDSTGVVGLRFQIDGQDLGSEITSGSCKAVWDSTQDNDGLHTIQAVGRDQYGNLTLAQPVTVLVSNTVFPTPTPTPGPSPAPAPAPEPTPAPMPPAGDQVVAITAPVAGTSVSGTTVSVSTRFPAETGFLTYFLLDQETNVVRWTTRGPELDRLQTSSSFTINVSGVPSGTYQLQVVARIGSTDVPSARIRVNLAPAPASVPALSMRLETTGGREYSLTALLARAGITVPLARVTFVVTSPHGYRWTYNATTNSLGVAMIKARLSRSDPKGTYQVTATATTTGLTTIASASFVY